VGSFKIRHWREADAPACLVNLFVHVLIFLRDLHGFLPDVLFGGSAIKACNENRYL
jgi:hypothetical protein